MGVLAGVLSTHQRIKKVHCEANISHAINRMHAQSIEKHYFFLTTNKSYCIVLSVFCY